MNVKKYVSCDFTAYPKTWAIIGPALEEAGRRGISKSFIVRRGVEGWLRENGFIAETKKGAK